jgi:hypothetical protein
MYLGVAMVFILFRLVHGKGIDNPKFENNNFKLIDLPEVVEESSFYWSNKQYYV